MALKVYSYDHLDYPSLVSILEKRGKDVHFVVPLGESCSDKTGPSQLIPRCKETNPGFWNPVSEQNRYPRWIGGKKSHSLLTTIKSNLHVHRRYTPVVLLIFYILSRC